MSCVCFDQWFVWLNEREKYCLSPLLVVKTATEISQYVLIN
jgi:hypothetical protein